MLKKVKESFWLGFIYAFSFMGLVQGWLGKDEYLKLVSNYWLDTHWSIWFFLIVYCIYKSFKINQVSKVIDRLKVSR